MTRSRPEPLAQVERADALNKGCYCLTLDAEALRRNLGADAESGSLMAGLIAERPHLFSSTAVFLTHSTFNAIEAGVACIERVIGMPSYEALALDRAPAIASRNFGPLGVFMSYDFHLGPSGPRLIEVNSNAGGALLNAALARAQRSCCQTMSEALLARPDPSRPERAFTEMFQQEWRRQRGEGRLQSLLVVDDDPASQYLAPEFELFRRLFERAGMASGVLDPSALRWRDGCLWHENASVDMIYSRLTDFYLDEARHTVLREAYEAGAVVLTPNPRTHALHADKRNLVSLSSPTLLRQWGVAAADLDTLERIVPPTRLVTFDRAEELWTQRRELFFKPATGYGAKAAYRGDKLTRRVWGEILNGTYIAQALVPPAERVVEVDNVRAELKFDLRAYTYHGRVQLLAARMYSGQTTNFRTRGGGFAPVFIVP